MDDNKTPKTKEAAENPGEAAKHTATQPPAQGAPEKQEEPESDDRFDFGGLPNRNLKKNLGCGG